MFQVNYCDLEISQVHLNFMELLETARSLQLEKLFIVNVGRLILTLELLCQIFVLFSINAKYLTTKSAHFPLHIFLEFNFVFFQLCKIHLKKHPSVICFLCFIRLFIHYCDFQTKP